MGAGFDGAGIGSGWLVTTGLPNWLGAGSDAGGGGFGGPAGGSGVSGDWVGCSSGIFITRLWLGQKPLYVAFSGKHKPLMIILKRFRGG
jgi:hypothetical protein